MISLPWNFSIDRARKDLEQFTTLAAETKSEVMETMVAADAAKSASLIVIAEANRVLVRR